MLERVEGGFESTAGGRGGGGEEEMEEEGISLSYNGYIN